MIPLQQSQLLKTTTNNNNNKKTPHKQDHFRPTKNFPMAFPTLCIKFKSLRIWPCRMRLFPTFLDAQVTMSHLLINLPAFFFLFLKFILLPQGLCPCPLHSLSYNGLPPDFCISASSQKLCLTDLYEEASSPSHWILLLPLLYCIDHSSSGNSVSSGIHKINVTRSQWFLLS